MNKVFFLAVTNHIATNVSQIKWVDADEGQLNVACRPPVAFPACLVDISYPQCESLSGGVQRIRARVELRVVCSAFVQGLSFGWCLLFRAARMLLHLLLCASGRWLGSMCWKPCTRRCSGGMAADCSTP